MLNFCEQIRRQPFFKPTMGPLLSNCFMETFKVKRRNNLSVEKKQDRFLGFALAALRSLISLLFSFGRSFIKRGEFFLPRIVSNFEWFPLGFPTGRDFLVPWDNGTSSNLATEQTGTGF